MTIMAEIVQEDGHYGVRAKRVEDGCEVYQDKDFNTGEYIATEARAQEIMEKIKSEMEAFVMVELPEPEKPKTEIELLKEQINDMAIAMAAMLGGAE